MCGITGFISNEGPTKSFQIVSRMCELLRHRGPDDCGIYQGDSIVLGQTRLSIIDLDAGHQPLSNEDSTVWITFNGEIYNYLELRKELLTSGHSFKTNTDTEVIVHLYEEYGIEMLDKLNGMFAFALWDARKKVLFLVRDRLGIKPLYYNIQGDKLIFASEMKALLVDPEISREIDKEAIAEYLVLSYIPEPRTPFIKIRKLPAGHYIRYANGKIIEQVYWRAPKMNFARQTSIADLCDQLLFLIEDATRLQLRADVPVGLFASGGLDSTAIMWAAARQNISLEGILVEFDHLSVDTPYARMASAATGIRLTEEHLSSHEAAKLLPGLIWYLDEPLADPAIVPCYLVAKQAVEKVKVILNGTGGDELFGGYPRYHVRGLLPGRWSAGLGKFFSAIPDSHAWGKKIGALLDFRQRYIRWLTLFPEEQVLAQLGINSKHSVTQLIDDLFAESAYNDPPAAMMFVDLNLYLPGNLFMLLDKMTMAVSLEARVPLLDHRLVEFVSALPGRLRMRGKELKWLLRRALRGHLPDQLLDRPKQGFGPPISKWFTGPLSSYCLKLLTGENNRLLNLFSAPWIKSWVNHDELKTGGSAMKTWALLVLELWWRVFMEDADLSQVSLPELVDNEGLRWI